MTTPSQPDPFEAMITGEPCDPIQLAEFTDHVQDILSHIEVSEYRKAQFLGATGIVELVSITTHATEPRSVIKVLEGRTVPLTFKLAGESPTEFMIGSEFNDDRGKLSRSVGRVVEAVSFSADYKFDPREWRIFENIINVVELISDVGIDEKVDIPDEVCADLSAGIQHLTRRRLPVAIAVQQDTEPLEDGRMLTIRNYEYSDGTQVEAGGTIAPYLHLEIARPGVDEEEEPTVIEVLNVWKDGMHEHIRRGQGVDLSRIGLRKRFEIYNASELAALNRSIDKDNLEEINQMLVEWALRKDLEAGLDPRSA